MIEVLDVAVDERWEKNASQARQGPGINPVSIEVVTEPGLKPENDPQKQNEIQWNGQGDRWKTKSVLVFHWAWNFKNKQ